MDQRIVDLEVRYTHIERLLGELSDVVYAQQRAIDNLVVRVQALEERMRALSEQAPGDAVPPHY